MKRLILIMMGLVCTVVIVHAQSPSEIRPLHIGDKLPDMKFDSVMDYFTDTARLSDFKSRLTILDFWSTSCSACIGFLPHLQSLRNKFKDSIQIILVDGQTNIWHDNEKNVSRTLKSLNDRTGSHITLPVVLGCTTLDDYFPYKRLPHEVWINSKGAVIAITGSEEVTAANISAILKGKKPKMRIKRDVFFDLEEHTLSSLIYGDLTYKHPLSSFVLVRGLIDGLGSSIGVRHADRPYSQLYTGLYLTNKSLLSLYDFAYKHKMQLMPNRIIVEGKDSVLFKNISSYEDTSVYRNVFSYDLTLPPTTYQNMIEHVQQDLASTFHTEVSVQNRKITCFILKTTKRTPKSFTKGGERKYVMNEFSPKKYIRNLPLSNLIYQLNRHYFTIPLIDKTGLKENIDMDFPYNLSQGSIIHALGKAGFEVKEEKNEMKVTVISNK